VKKILVYASPERHCSLFDLIVAHDAGADVVIPYSYVTLEDVKDIVYGCCFTRHPRDLVNTGIFVGGYSVGNAEELASAALEILDGLPKELRVNIALDPNGAYTTASACVAKIASAVRVKGLKATVLAGTGPVGMSTARLLAGMGASVTITSRRIERARKTAELIGKGVKGVQAANAKQVPEAVKDAAVVVSAGPPGIELLPESVWACCKRIKVLADANVVPPYGIEGVHPRDDGRVVGSNRRCYGALAIGSLKMELHRMIIQKMFEERDVLFNLDRIYSLYDNSLLR
jgi:hypothetical protein